MCHKGQPAANTSAKLPARPAKGTSAEQFQTEQGAVVIFGRAADKAPVLPLRPRSQQQSPAAINLYLPSSREVKTAMPAASNRKPGDRSAVSAWCSFGINISVAIAPIIPTGMLIKRSRPRCAAPPADRRAPGQAAARPEGIVTKVIAAIYCSRGTDFHHRQPADRTIIAPPTPCARTSNSSFGVPGAQAQ